MLRVATSKLLTVAALVVPPPTTADVTLDGTMGPGGPLAGPDFTVPHTVGAIGGSNLFHSFGVFDVRVGESVTFTGPGAITDIIARVTGGAPSRIDGALRSEVGSADLWFINPAGVALGSDAELDLPGSLYVATADAIKFADGAVYRANGPSPTPLTTAPPEAFGFLGSTPSPVTVDARGLSLEQGRTLAVVGGDITIGSEENVFVQIQSGRLLLVSVASPGNVFPRALHRPPTSPRLGRMTLRGRTDQIDAAGEGGDEVDDAPDSNLTVSGDPGGEVVIRAGSLVIDGFSIAANTQGDTDGARVGIEVAVSGALEFSGEAQLASITEGTGRGGDVVLSAASVQMTEDTEFLSDTRGSGPGGSIFLAAGRVTLSGDAEIASDVDEGASGRAGHVVIEAGVISLEGDSEISSDTGGSGPGGVVELRAAQALLVRDQAGILTDAEAAGAAGSIIIGAPRVRMSGGLISAETAGAGTGGDVVIEAERIRVSRGGRISAASEGSGRTGRVLLSARSVELDQGTVSTEARSSDGGDITFIVHSLVRVRDSEITTSVGSGEGAGGNIFIDPDFVVLQNARIVANAFGGPGGNIHIVAGAFIATPSSVVDASSALAIDGTVDIDAPDSDVSAGLVPLPSSFSNAQGVASSPCETRAGSRRSSLTAQGRAGLPPRPSGYLPSPWSRLEIGGLPETTSRARAEPARAGPDTAVGAVVSSTVSTGSCR